MSSSEVETILVVCADTDRAAAIIGRLHDEGANAVGPAPTAAIALMLAAQLSPRSAVLAGPPAGRRHARELAQALEGVWGVECFVLPADGDDIVVEEGTPERRTAKLRRLLGAATLRRAEAH